MTGLSADRSPLVRESRITHRLDTTATLKRAEGRLGVGRPQPLGAGS